MRTVSARRGSGALLFAALLMAHAPAAAAPDAAEEPDAKAGELTPDGVGFWDWLLDPHGREIEVVLQKAEKNLSSALKDYKAWDYNGRYKPGNAENRRRLLDDAEGMLRYGLELDPHNVRLKLLLGRVADENDHPEVARRALEDYLADELPERIRAEARWRLGRIYARQGRWKRAVVELRLALGSPQANRMQATQTYLSLATVYMELGRLAEAIDLLRHSLGSMGYAPYSGNYVLQFALAVAYDRDEQITLAHETLDKIIAGNRRQNLLQVLRDPQDNTRVRFTPAIDRHYFTALQLEAMGHLVEARREWKAYAAHEGARYRGRALEHVEEIERMLASKRAGRTGGGP